MSSDAELLLDTASALQRAFDSTCCMATHGATPAVIGRADDPALKLAELSVEGMTCAACSGAVERALKQMNGVEQAEFSFGRAIG